MPYNLPENYQSRLTPDYFHDTLTDSTLWQADVYRLAALLARKANIKRIVDIGCGTGGKLVKFINEFKLVGIDYADNIAYCDDYYKNMGLWLEYNLNEQIVPSELFKDSIIICADIIEHLPTPDALIKTLHNASKTAAYVLVSTPDRERLQQGTENGPPANKAHCREWTLAELEDWFVSEGLPVRWSGWTISYDKQPDKVNTSLIILSQNRERIQLPITFQPERHWRVWPKNHNSILKVWMTPTPTEAGRDVTNAIHQIVVRLDKYLPDYGVELVEQPDNAAVHAGHAGQGSQAPLDVCHFHGLYNSAQGGENYAVNAAVIRNLKTARIITAPSEWIADVIRRDMHVNPRVIGWGVDTEEWTPSAAHQQYVIWNKARVDNISTPQPMLELAARAHDVLFLTTFGEGTPNVKTIGRQLYPVMKEYVRNAAVYLSLNVETFGIGLVESMAAGVPILGFRQGNLPALIEHGIHGFMAEPGDMDGLYEGLRYCLKHRDRLGANAREAAKRWTWQRVAEQFAGIYHEIIDMKADVRPHRIDERLYK